MELQEYYIKLNAVLKYTSYSSEELSLIFKDVNKDLKIISHSVYRLMYDMRRGINKYNHKKYIRKKIYDNAEEEVTVLILAMIEAVKGAIESGMDLNAYINDPKETFPKTVYQELRQAELLNTADKLDNDDLDIDYTAEEISLTSAEV